jgi:hypothetical protein
VLGNTYIIYELMNISFVYMEHKLIDRHQLAIGFNQQMPFFLANLWQLCVNLEVIFLTSIWIWW